MPVPGAGRPSPSASEPRAPHCRADRGGQAVDLLLTHSLFMALDPKQVQRQMPYPPLGTLYAAAALRKAGLRVALFDAMLAPGPEAFPAAIEACRPKLVAIYEDSFNWLSKMCLTRMRQAGLSMLESARRAGLPVLVHGSDPSDLPSAWLAAGATAVIVGEGEQTLVEAARRLLQPGPQAREEVLGDVAGLVLPGTDPRPGRQRPIETRPDRFEPPARDLVDLDAYRRIWHAAHGHFRLNVAASRGCPYACNWCARPIWGRRHAARSPEAVAEELAELAASAAPDRIWFVDDVFGLAPGWTSAFGAAMARRKLRLPFQAQSRVDLIDEAYAEGLARAGCEELWLGVESGSQRILDAMQKGYRSTELPAAVERLRRHGIRVAFFLQLGYPGEVWTDIEASADLVRRLRPDAIGVSVSYPLPGTPFHARVAAGMGRQDHWEDSRDLAMLFQGTYRTDFYRALHAALHREHAAMLNLDRPLGALERQEAERELAEAQAAWLALAAGEAAARSAEPSRLSLAADAG